jgi:Flp pilus assembly protein TadD
MAGVGWGIAVIRVALVMPVCLALLAGCKTAPPFGDAAFKAAGETGVTAETATDAYAATTAGETFVAPDTVGSTPAGLLGSDPKDDLSLGKKQFKANNHGLAEQHFRKAVEAHPKDGEAWAGLAASYDRLQRFDLADRAYREAMQILGPTPELLNNQGFSYMLRGDYRRAREVLRKAQAADPRNPYILNNLNLLEKSARTGKSID